MINRRIRRSFAAKLTFWILLLTLPVFLASVGLHFMNTRKMIMAESVERANGVLEASLQHICRYLVTVETATNTYGWMAEAMVKNPDSLMSLTRRVVYLNPYIDGCAIGLEPSASLRGSRYFMTYSLREEDDSITAVQETDYNYFKKNWYRRPRDQRQPCWVAYYDENNELELDEYGMIATYGKPLYGTDSTLVGVLSTELSLLHLSKILAEETPYPHAYFMLIDEKGRYVGHPDSTRLFKKTIFDMGNQMNQADLLALGYAMTNGQQGQMSVVIKDMPSLVCFRPVPGTTWSLAIICPDSDILRSYNRFTYIVMLLLFMGLVLIVLYCYRMMTFSLHPLRVLLAKTQEIAKGNMELAIKHSTRVDDIGRLQNSYASMLESLNFHMGSVRYTSEQIQHRNEELIEATKMAEESDRQKTKFIQNVTHQIRTPLNIIMGYAQILDIPTDEAEAAGVVSGDEVKSLVKAMDYNSKLLNRLVLMLADSSGYEEKIVVYSEKNDVVAVNETVREKIRYVQCACADVQIKFETEVPDSLTITTNERILHYSLAEVLFNALKYSDREHILVRVIRTGSNVRFIIEDKGKGIAEKDRENIFKFFTKADDFSEGLGLGLPLTKRHAKALGGDFFLDPNYHDGCRFVFELPI